MEAAARPGDQREEVWRIIGSADWESGQQESVLLARDASAAGRTALHLAAAAGNRGVAEELCRWGYTDPFLEDEGKRTALDLAREAGHHDVEVVIVKVCESLREWGSTQGL